MNQWVIITMRYHYNPLECLKILKLISNIGKDMEKLEPYTQLVGMQNGTITLENCLSASKKLSIHWVYKIAIPFLDIYPIKVKTCVYKNPGTKMFIGALFIIATY